MWRPTERIFHKPTGGPWPTLDKAARSRQRHRQVTCELWDRLALDEPGAVLAKDGKRRLTPPSWPEP